MSIAQQKILLYAVILVLGIGGPLIFPNYTFQISVLWVMILFALTWDILGGQMGYNSLGNIFFFGVGMYTCALVQVGLYTDVSVYTSATGGANLRLTPEEYFIGLGLGAFAGAIVASIFAVIFGWVVFGLRGPYFAIGTLGFTLAAGELVGAWEWVGGGGGIALPVYPGPPDERSLLFNFLCFILAVIAFLTVKWMYAGQFGLAANAIRDDEEKAEAMGIHTLRYKTVGWTIAAFFLGISGAIFGNMVGFIEPLEVAFPTVTFGIFMVVMCLLGGKGTLWGPVVGAALFHIFKEVTWTYMLGWQWVALGALIIILVVFFQQGVMGWLQEKWPSRFGITVDENVVAKKSSEAAQ
ncbi:MAG: branched-chain amino acid ABC transporter permease [Alphaproteobacteria bacterium]|nr:branched-chain amino acid ABC transporter permease [Alphaproteobacteria bacterium]